MIFFMMNSPRKSEILRQRAMLPMSLVTTAPVIEPVCAEHLWVNTGLVLTAGWNKSDHLMVCATVATASARRHRLHSRSGHAHRCRIRRLAYLAILGEPDGILRRRSR